MSQGLLLAGNVFVDRLTDTGQSTGLQGPLNATQLAIKTPTEEKTRTSRKKANYGQALDSVMIAQPTEVELTLDEVPSDVLAMALLGETETINVGSGNVTDEDVTLPAGGRWVSLAQSNLAAEGISAKLASDDSAIAVADIEVNYAAGLARATPGGSLADAATAIKISYSHNALSGTRVKGGIKPLINARILLEGTNLTTGKPARVEIYKASIAPTDAVDFMADDFVSTKLTGKALVVAGQDQPFSYDELEA